MSGLRELAAQAEAGSLLAISDLGELAPDMAALLADTAEAIQNVEEIYDLGVPAFEALLARYAALNQKAAQ